MQKLVLILTFLAINSMAITFREDELQVLWKFWKAYNDKTYGQREDAVRFTIFMDNYQKILTFNAEHESTKLGLNKFADLTAEEFKNLYCSLFSGSTKSKPLASNYANYELRDLPASVDWRQKGAVTPVQNQEECGAGWAFSGIGALEGLYFINQGQLISFSPQQLIDCDTAQGGCNGGAIDQAFNYTAEYGIEPASDYPYIGKQDTCKYDASDAIKVNPSYSNVEPKSTDALKTAIVEQPVSVEVMANAMVFQFYISGVIQDSCGADVDHYVLIVGYGTIENVEVFIVKNSWGTNWGIEGYTYISSDGSANEGKGVCGILTQPVVPST